MSRATCAPRSRAVCDVAAAADVDVCVAPCTRSSSGSSEEHDDAGRLGGSAASATQSATAALQSALHGYAQRLAAQQYQVNRAYDTLRVYIERSLAAVAPVPCKQHASAQEKTDDSNTSKNKNADDVRVAAQQAVLSEALVHMVRGTHTLFRFLYERVFVHQLESDMCVLRDVMLHAPPLLRAPPPPRHEQQRSTGTGSSDEDGDSDAHKHTRNAARRDHVAAVTAAVDVARRAPLQLQRAQTRHLARLSPLLLTSSTTAAAVAASSRRDDAEAAARVDAAATSSVTTTPQPQPLVVVGGETVVGRAVRRLFAVSAHYSAAEQHALVHLITRVLHLGVVVLPDMSACRHRERDDTNDNNNDNNDSSSSSSKRTAIADDEVALAVLLSCRCLVTPHAPTARPQPPVLSISKEMLECYMQQHGVLPRDTHASSQQQQQQQREQAHERADDDTAAGGGAAAGEDDELTRLLESLDRALLVQATHDTTTMSTSSHSGGSGSYNTAGAAVVARSQAQVATSVTGLAVAHVNTRRVAHKRTRATAATTTTAATVLGDGRDTCAPDTWTSLTTTAMTPDNKNDDDDEDAAMARRDGDDDAPRDGRHVWHRHDDVDDRNGCRHAHGGLQGVVESQQIEYKHHHQDDSCSNNSNNASAHAHDVADEGEATQDDEHVATTTTTTAEGATTASTPWVFQISHSLRDIRDALMAAIAQLGARVEHSVHYSPRTTHLVLTEGVTERTEKYLSCCAAGAYVVSPRYVFDSARRGRWLLGSALASYDANPCRRFASLWPAYCPTRHHHNSSSCHGGGGGDGRMFSSWRVLLFASSVFIAKGITTILRAGGCRSVHAFHCSGGGGGGAAATTTATATATRHDDASRDDGDGDVVTLTPGLSPHTVVDATWLTRCTHVLVECTAMMSAPALRAYFALPSWYPRMLRQPALYTRTYTLELLYYCLCTSTRRVFDDVSGQLVSEDALVPACRVAPFALQRD